MLITIERRASCSMFARSCKHPVTDVRVASQYLLFRVYSVWGQLQMLFHCSKLTRVKLFPVFNML